MCKGYLSAEGSHYLYSVGTMKTAIKNWGSCRTEGTPAHPSYWKDKIDLSQGGCQEVSSTAVAVGIPNKHVLCSIVNHIIIHTTGRCRFKIIFVQHRCLSLIRNETRNSQKIIKQSKGVSILKKKIYLDRHLCKIIYSFLSCQWNIFTSF